MKPPHSERRERQRRYLFDERRERQRRYLFDLAAIYERSANELAPLTTQNETPAGIATDRPAH